MMKNRIFVLLLLVFSALVPNALAGATQQSASDLAALINNVRTSNGISSLEINNALSAAAQAQADFLAATYGSEPDAITDWHTGQGGSDEYNRALGAGYPFGPGWTVDEIAYGGSGTSTANDALRWWLNSTVHATAIYNPDNVHIGAGISTGEGYAYYVVVFGLEFGSGGATDGGVASTVPKTAVTPQVAPVAVATANPNGSVFHTVESGQALWSIAIAYDITIDQILALNNLKANAIIYEGQTLQVRAAYTPTPAPTETNTPPAPTKTPIPAQTAQALRTQEATPESGKGTLLGMDNQTMGIALILISGIGLIMIVAGNFAKDKAAKKQDKE